jgi:hypothetical protein
MASLTRGFLGVLTSILTEMGVAGNLSLKTYGPGPDAPRALPFD